MSSEPVLEARGLKKTFRLYRRSRDRFLELLTRRIRHQDFAALDDISLVLEPGQILGIVGENGSGKSTLLKLVAGILLPDAGHIVRRGRIAGLLELGTGFNQELSGRRNIYLNGVYLNMSPALLAEMEEEIIEFAELGDFIDEPLKNYSSGMIMRLAFSIAIHSRPDCFIIDEALSVGDIRFQQKCFARLQAFKKNGGSILFVSHDLNAIKLLCDQAIFLDHGKTRFIGGPDETVNIFNEFMAAKGDSGQKTQVGYGNATVYFVSAEVCDANGNPVAAVASGEPMLVKFSYACNQPTPGVTFGIMIRDRFGQDVFGTNGALLDRLADVSRGGEGIFRFGAMNIDKGSYTINLAAHTGTTHLENCFHWWDNAAVFEIQEDPNYRFSGHTRLAADLEIMRGTQKNDGKNI